MNKSEKRKPIIGITIGDINGIGPEVVMKSFTDNRILKNFIPVIYASTKFISHYRKILSIDNFNFHQAKSLDGLNYKKLNVINCWQDNVEVTPGESNELGGKYALLSMEMAVDDLINEKIDAMVTAPINKENIQSDNFDFPGHTEYLTEKAGKKDSLMLMVSDKLRVGMATGHIPLKKVSETLTSELLTDKISILNNSLKKDFNIQKPRIAVLGLNPHAGENGLLGQEEKDIIVPVIKHCKEKKDIMAFGPFPADGFFGNFQYQFFDGVLAMYHDQGLIPFKNISFEEGVNFTAGLPIVRTSPDHGTAYNLVGKNTANYRSFQEAVFLAYTILLNRGEFEV